MTCLVGLRRSLARLKGGKTCIPAPIREVRSRRYHFILGRAITREMIAADLTRLRRGAIVGRVAAAYISRGCLDHLARTACPARPPIPLEPDFRFPTQFVVSLANVHCCSCSESAARFPLLVEWPSPAYRKQSPCRQFCCSPSASRSHRFHPVTRFGANCATRNWQFHGSIEACEPPLASPPPPWPDPYLISPRAK